MAFKLSDLNEITSSILTDIFHVRNATGLDKKITNENLFKNIPGDVGVGGTLSTDDINERTTGHGVRFGSDLYFENRKLKRSISPFAARIFNSPSTLITGATFDGTNLITVDRTSGLIYIHDGISDSILSSFSSPGTSGGEYGLAFDETTGNLISGNAITDKIYIHNGVSSSVLSSFNSPGGVLKGLTVINGNLYSTDSGTSTIYKHNGISSSILSSFAVPSRRPYLNAAIEGDLAFDGENLISSDSTNSLIFVHSGETRDLLCWMNSPVYANTAMTFANGHLISGGNARDRIAVHSSQLLMIEEE